jgi:hypothetical protein
MFKCTIISDKKKKMYNNKTKVVLVFYHTNIVWQKILEYSTRLKSFGEIIYFQSTTKKNCNFINK